MLPTKPFRVLLLLICTLALPMLHAEDRDPALPVTVLETVVVSGTQPGPGMWKVSKGEHVMWILGTLSPLPKSMDWASENVVNTIARSQQVLMTPSVSMKVKGGVFGGLFLIPSLLKARNNPDEQKLVDVLPATLYARWQVLKQRYLGRNRGVEKRRPIVAAQELQEEVLDDVDLSTKNVAADVVRRAAKRYDVPITEPKVEITITDPKATIRELSASSLDDVECFDKILARLESEIETMKLRANAWAVGEVDILVKLVTTDSYRACAAALLETRIAKRHGFDDLEAQIATSWLAAADATLDKYASSVAVLPLPLMLRQGGYLAALEARGYRVEAPGATP